MDPYSQDSLAARRRRRRRRRRQVHLRGPLSAVVALPPVLTLGGVASTSGGGGETPPAPARAIFKRARIFPRGDRAARLPYVARAGRRKREIALPFDDGPGPYTA